MYRSLIRTPTRFPRRPKSEAHLGPPRLITDANGNVVSHYDCTPFGSEINSSFRTVNGTALTDAFSRECSFTFERPS